MSRTLPLTRDKVKSLFHATSLTNAAASLIFDILFPTTHNATFLGLALVTALWTLAFGFMTRPLERKKRKKTPASQRRARRACMYAATEIKQTRSIHGVPPYQVLVPSR